MPSEFATGFRYFIVMICTTWANKRGISTEQLDGLAAAFVAFAAAAWGIYRQYVIKKGIQNESK